MPNLFDPLEIRSVAIRNRIAVSPMCQYSSEEGRATDWHLVHLGARAVGGAGLVMCEATAVSREGRLSPGDAGLWSDDQIEPLARINGFLMQHGATPAIQLAHGGRKAGATPPWEPARQLGDDEGGWETIGPTAEPFGDKLTRAPRAMSREEIVRVQGAFRDATVRALEAGYQMVELHGAHGYLAHEFYSPLVNKRTDEYGGGFENRIRFILQTARAMREVWPDNLPMAARLSCTDWVEGGWDIEQTVELARRLKVLGVDLIDCSSGGAIPGVKIPAGPGYQTPFAARVRREVGVLTSAVGLIVAPAQADQIVRNGDADVVMLAREMLRDPYWPFRAARALGKADLVKLPVQYAHSV